MIKITVGEKFLWYQIDDLIPTQGNLKELSESNYTKLKNQIKKEGFCSPFYVWINDQGFPELLDGHQRQLVLKMMRDKESIDIPDKFPCVHVKAESREQAARILLALTSQYGTITSEGLYEYASEQNIPLQEIVDSVNLDAFKMEDFKDEFIDTPAEMEDSEKDDEVPEVKKESIVKRGDIWLLGNHRLMCGDSTNKEDVEKLMNGEKADMVFTDPPYNTGMTPQSQAGCGGLRKGNEKKNETSWLPHMFNDSYTEDEWQKFMSDFCSMYRSQMKENTGAYICLDWRRNHELIPHIKNNFKLSNVIVWDKVVHGLGSDYKYTYELINVCKKGKPELDTHQGEREYSDVWHIQRAIGRNKDHATAKPTELVARCLRHASKPNALCIDLFLGSGTTLIACEKTNRKCYGMELEDHYCQVIIDRYINYIESDETVFLLKDNGEKIPYKNLI